MTDCPDGLECRECGKWPHHGPCRQLTNERLADLLDRLAMRAVEKMTENERYNFLYSAHHDYLSDMPEADLLILCENWNVPV